MINIIRIIFVIIINVLGILCPNAQLFNCLLYLNNLTFGLAKPIIRDLRKYKHDCNILVYNHNSYTDNFILTAVFGIANVTFLIHSKVADIPFVKQYVNNYQVIVVDPVKKDTTQKIINYANDITKVKYLAMAPAASHAQYDDKIGKFASGAFVPMKPVLPVIIKYKDDKGTWFNEDKTHMKDFKEWFIKMFQLQFRISLYQTEVTIMEEVTPDGCQTPKEYAAKVEQIMRKEYYG
jgi:1-acyl-sn-glycerol-3-phosphate acyltransferase